MFEVEEIKLVNQAELLAPAQLTIQDPHPSLKNLTEFISHENFSADYSAILQLMSELTRKW